MWYSGRNASSLEESADCDTGLMQLRAACKQNKQHRENNGIHSMAKHNGKWQWQVNCFETLLWKKTISSHESPDNPFITQKLTAQSPAKEAIQFHHIEMHGHIL